MGETAHTPTPWLREKLTVYALNPTGTNQFSAHVDGGWTWQGQNPTPADRTTDAELEANAALIVRAVNHHETLVRELENVVLNATMSDEYRAKLRELLALAKGAQ